MTVTPDPTTNDKLPSSPHQNTQDVVETPDTSAEHGAESSSDGEPRNAHRIIGDYTYLLGYDRRDLYKKYSPTAEKWIDELIHQQRAEAYEQAKQEFRDKFGIDPTKKYDVRHSDTAIIAQLSTKPKGDE
tara:strand:- start:12392 stop:12781 length:390 start_codon:yes stop_codon:yes gene_type:complete